MIHIQKKVVVIAGGMGYVGSAIARRLAKDGLVVAILYRNSSPEAVAELIGTLPGTSHKAYQCDLSTSQAVVDTIGLIEKEMGPLYAGIYAAGEMPMLKQLHQLTTDDFAEEIKKSLIPSFAFLSACGLRLKEQKAGVLVGITTAGVVTEHGTKARGAYSAVKFGQQGILVALREELIKSGIRVYSVAPGAMAGGLNKAIPRAFLDMVAAQGPKKKLATADDVASAVSELVFDEAGHKNMTTLVAPECEGE